MPRDKDSPEIRIIFPENARWLWVRDISDKVARDEATSLINRYVEGDGRIMANRYGEDKFTLRATNSTVEVEVLCGDDEKTFVVLAVNEA